MPDCIFCKIINREIPADIVYEDENFVAFLDIRPINLGHTVLAPKAHYQDLFDLPTEILSKLGPVAQTVGRAIKDGTQADGLNLGMNNGRTAGQLVWHAHLHLIPRFADDGLRHWPGKTAIAPEEFKKTAEAISKLL